MVPTYEPDDSVRVTASLVEVDSGVGDAVVSSVVAVSVAGSVAV